MTYKPFISVVVCTYNRAGVLDYALNSLAGQNADSDCYEVIIVDNRSSDQTNEIAAAYVERYANFRYVFEEEQGLSHARNRGYREAAGEYVAYIDDDAKAQPEWIQTMIQFISEFNPDVFGGPYSAYYLGEKPKWFKDRYASMSLGFEVKTLGPDEWLSGTNMIYRKVVLQQMDGFKVKLGMSGSKTGYGEETNMLMRLKQKGIKIYYCPSLLVEHLVLSGKLTVRWFLKSNYCNGYYFADKFELGQTKLRCFLSFIKSILLFCLNFAVSGELNLKCRFIETFSSVAYSFGKLVRSFN